MQTVFRKFSKLALLLIAVLPVSAQVVIRPGITGSSWTAGMSCATGTYVTSTPDNLHVFRAVNIATGTAAGTQPSWNTQSGSLTLDGSCAWKEFGTSGLGGIDLSANYVFTGTDQFSLGLRLGPITFTNLPSATDGTIVYCPDCQAISPCLGLGTGAFAQRVNGSWLCASGSGGGGGGLPGGPNTGIQVNDNGVLNSFAGLTYTKGTSTFGLPDGSTWSPSGLFPPNPTSNIILNLDSSSAQGHAFVFKTLSTGQVCLQGGGAGFNFVCVNGDTHNGATPPSASIQAGDASSHAMGLILYPFGNSHADQLGYTFANGVFQVSTDLNPGPGCIFCVDRVNKSVHIYGPLYMPDAAGTGNSTGALGAALLSQGSSTPAKWSSDVTGVFGIIGTFGSCAGVTPSGTQSALCFGPSGHIQGSWAADTFQDLVRANNIPAAGITGLVEPAQIDLTNPGGLGGLYAPLNPVAQYNVPEWGASNVGPVTGPFNDAVDNIVTASKPIDLGTTSIGSDYANCASTGTTLNKLVKLSSSAGATCGVIASIADTQGEVGVCVGRCGTTGSGVIAHHGKVSLVMDGATTVNDWVINSPSVAGDGRDTGSTTCPTSGAQVIGQVLSTNASGGTFTVQLRGCDTTGGGGGGGGLADPGSNGIVVRTALNTTTARTLATADSTHIGITNADGTAGNPTLDIGSNVAVLNAANTAGSSMKLNMSAAPTADGLKVPVSAGAAPTASAAIAYDSTGNNFVVGKNGTGYTVCTTAGESGCGSSGAVFWAFIRGTTNTNLTASNITRVWAYQLPVSLTGVTKLSYGVATADNSGNLYDLGIYNSSGTLLCHTGATAGTTLAPSTGDKVLSFTASCNMPAGEYYFAVTGNSATMFLGGSNDIATVACGATTATNSTTSGGVLNSSVTFSADALVTCIIPQLTVSTK